MNGEREQEKPNKVLEYLGVLIIILSFVIPIKWYCNKMDKQHEQEAKKEANNIKMLENKFIETGIGPILIDFAEQYASNLEKYYNSSGDVKGAGFTDFKITIEDSKPFFKNNRWYFIIKIPIGYYSIMEDIMGGALKDKHLVRVKGKLTEIKNDLVKDIEGNKFKAPETDLKVWVFSGEYTENPYKFYFSNVCTADDSATLADRVEQNNINRKLTEHLKSKYILMSK